MLSTILGHGLPNKTNIPQHSNDGHQITLLSYITSDGHQLRYCTISYATLSLILPKLTKLGTTIQQIFPKYLCNGYSHTYYLVIIINV